MKFRAVVKNEGTVEVPWFVYVQTEHGHTVYACRFNAKAHAEQVARSMNQAWAVEGRLYEPKFDD